MTEKERKQKAKEFAEYWKDKGYEKGQSQKFWLSFLRDILGMDKPEQIIEFEETVKEEHTKFIDGWIDSTKVLIEQKSSSVNLRLPIKQSDGSLLTPFQQALNYNKSRPYSKRARWIITCNFQEFLIYDMEKPNGEPESILLKDLPKECYRLQFIVEQKNELLHKEEQISIEAGKLVGVLYEALLKQYNDKDEQELKSLNEFCVRIIFCLYAEDSGLFGEKLTFHNYIKNYSSKDLRRALIDLFKVLDTKIENRDKYLGEDLAKFPYVNGGLFSNENLIIPQLTDEIRNILLRDASENFDWSEINIEYWSCSACDKKFSNEDSTDEITAVVVSKTGLHDYDLNGICTNCGIERVVDVWDGTVAIGFGSGDGSANNPYIISSSAEFAYFNLSNIALPNSVTSIGNYSFKYCNSLGSIIIPYAVTVVGNNCFSNTTTVFVQTASVPKTWDASWNSDGCPVIYDYDGIAREYTFITNGGTSVEKITATYVASLPITSRDGYYFMGWYTDSEFSGDPVSSYYCSKTQTTLYAKWFTEEEYIAHCDGSSFEKAIHAENNKAYTVTIDEAGEYYYFSFVPTESTSYTIYSQCDTDTYGYLYAASQSQITSNDDGGEGNNFSITYELVAGETYYIAVRFYSSSKTGTFTVVFGKSVS